VYGLALLLVLNMDICNKLVFVYYYYICL